MSPERRAGKDPQVAGQVWESVFCQIMEWPSTGQCHKGEKNDTQRPQRPALPTLVMRRRESESEIASLKVTCCQRCLHPKLPSTSKTKVGVELSCPSTENGTVCIRQHCVLGTQEHRVSQQRYTSLKNLKTCLVQAPT